MGNELKKLVMICVIRYLNGDMDEFFRLKDIALQLYTGGKCTINGGPLQATIEEILNAKGAKVC